MSKSVFVPDIEPIPRDQWSRLRDLRLSALRDSPREFLAEYDRERAFDQARWQAEFDRGAWYCSRSDGRPIGLVGATREQGAPSHERYIEYLWVSPEARGRGVAQTMLTTVLKDLSESEVRTAFLWVLDGNDTAVRLYERVGFVSTGHRQPIAARPGRTEERMMMALR